MLDSEEHGISVYSGGGCSSKGQGYIVLMPFSLNTYTIVMTKAPSRQADIESLLKLVELEEFKLFLLEPAVLGRGLETEPES